MNTEYEQEIYTDSKKLPMEYLMLQYRMSLNKALLESKIISYDIFSKMQTIIIKKMNEIILKNIK